MSQQIAIRLEDHELAALDAEVANGLANNRSHAVRRAIARLERQQRYRREEIILAELMAAGEEVYPDLAGMHDRPYPSLD